MSDQGSNYLRGGLSGGNLNAAAFLPPNTSESCCWIVLATTDCSTSRASVSATAGAAASKDSCCWIVVATTGCSVAATAQGGGGAADNLKAGAAESCCWIILATTDCSTSALEAKAPANVAAGCCWVLLATTGCTT